AKVVHQDCRIDAEVKEKNAANTEYRRYYGSGRGRFHIDLEVAGQFEQEVQLVETTVEQNDLGRVAGDRSGAAEGNRSIGLFKCNGIVDAVTDKTDLAPLILQLPYENRLVLGKYLSEVMLDTEIFRQGSRGFI